MEGLHSLGSISPSPPWSDPGAIEFHCPPLLGVWFSEAPRGRLNTRIQQCLPGAGGKSRTRCYSDIRSSEALSHRLCGAPVN